MAEAKIKDHLQNIDSMTKLLIWAKKKKQTVRGSSS
jgi:hypothetical protein